jgi:hypothetical protein
MYAQSVHSTLYSLSNPNVHSLSVTLGNHAIPPFQPYNCPCPIGHFLKRNLATDVFFAFPENILQSVQNSVGQS